MTFAQYDDNIVVAQEWEGIYEILLRNELVPKIHKTPFIELNKQKLNGDTMLIAGITYLLPDRIKTPIAEKKIVPKTKTNLYPIFGKKYEQVPSIDNNLEGTVFYLVSGHGGPDPGALGKYGNYTLSEDEYAYDVTLRLTRNLISHGATVYLIIQDKSDGIRDDAILRMDKNEKTISNQELPLNQKERLKQRADEINNLYYRNRGAFQRLITIHIDSRSKGQNIDVFFYHHHNSRRGKNLAKEIQKIFQAKYEKHQPGRNYRGTVSSRSSLYMVKNTLPPMVYIELGNIQNYRDQLRFVRSDNRQALANWIELGILNDYKKSKN
ncbi:MAG: N-acetylmuramoyl-L-alanine amidase [Cyclobacteriaceae bacterium]|nr:N-acetylmuramoyl-L-alanine amidase [Cyclobacteriaceae bacterium]